MNTLKVKNSNNEWVDIPGLVGPQGATGPQGPAGPAGADGAPGVGVPTGGNSGQILAKNSNTDYDTKWIDAPQSGSSSGDNELISYTANSYYKTEKSTLPMLWITDGAAAPLQELKVTYDIKQEGSGTPSPTNRRNFIKQDSTQIAHYGRNLFNIDDIVSDTEGVTVTKFENGFKVINDTDTTYSNVFHGLDIKLNGTGATTYLFFSYDGPAAGTTTYRYSTNFGNTWGASNNSWVPAYYGYGALAMTSGVTNVQPVRSLNAHSSITITNPMICLVNYSDVSKTDIPYVPYEEYSGTYTIDLPGNEEDHYQWEYDCISGKFTSQYDFVLINNINIFDDDVFDNDDNTILLDFWSEVSHNLDLNLIKCNCFAVNSTNFTVKDNKLYLKQAAWSQLGSTLTEVNTAIQANPIQLLIPPMINQSEYGENYIIDTFRGGNTFWTKYGKISSITYATTGIDALSNVKAPINVLGVLQYNSTIKMWEPRNIEALVYNCSLSSKGFRNVYINYDEDLEKYYIFDAPIEYNDYASVGVPLNLHIGQQKYNSSLDEYQYKGNDYQLISADNESVVVDNAIVEIYTFRFLKIDDNSGTITPIIFKTTPTSQGMALLVNDPGDIFDDGWDNGFGGGT